MGIGETIRAVLIVLNTIFFMGYYFTNNVSRALVFLVGAFSLIIIGHLIEVKSILEKLQ